MLGVFQEEKLYDCVVSGGKDECLPSAGGFPGLPLPDCRAACRAPPVVAEEMAAGGV